MDGGFAGGSALASRLKREIAGDVWFDAASRGRYATDASIYQVMPLGVVRPKSMDDVAAAIAFAAEEGVPVMARGGGTSQCGQTVGEAIVIDTSRYLDAILDVNPEAMTARVEPGVVLAELNGRLAKDGLFFPVDPSTASRCTLGGMTANNSSGARSIRYGIMADNVSAVDALLADGSRRRFGPVADGDEDELAGFLSGLAKREADEIAKRVPKVLRHVAGYNLHRVAPEGAFNMADIMVGSEGTLGFFEAIDLKLVRAPARKVVGICQFPSFHQLVILSLLCFVLFKEIGPRRNFFIIFGQLKIDLLNFFLKIADLSFDLC